MHSFYEDRFDFRIEERMQDRYEEILQKFRRFVREDLIDDILACVGLALQEETKEAEKIAEVMGLSQADIHCINWDVAEYKKSLDQEFYDAETYYIISERN